LKLFAMPTYKNQEMKPQ